MTIVAMNAMYALRSNAKKKRMRKGVLKENVKCSHKTIDYFRCIEAKIDTFCEDASESIRCCMKTAYDVISFILQVVRSDCHRKSSSLRAVMN